MGPRKMGRCNYLQGSHGGTDIGNRLVDKGGGGEGGGDRSREAHTPAV